MSSCQSCAIHNFHSYNMLYGHSILVRVVYPIGRVCRFCPFGFMLPDPLWFGILIYSKISPRWAAFPLSLDHWGCCLLPLRPLFGFDLCLHQPKQKERLRGTVRQCCLFCFLQFLSWNFCPLCVVFIYMCLCILAYRYCAYTLTLMSVPL